MNISVIGSGGWGTALALLAAKNDHNVTLWSYFPEESARLRADRENREFLPGVPFGDLPLHFTSDLAEAAQSADIIISAVPSKAVRTTARNLAPYAARKLIVSVSKGVEDESLLRLSEVIAQEIPTATVAVLSGPSHAEEVARDIPTTNVVACSDAAAARTVQDALMRETFRIYTNSDLCGVELGGALKNVIALCAGIVDGLGLGDNTKAALMTRGLHEISRLGVKMGAQEQTFAGLSGVGDLIMTCTSMHSRNRRAGILLGQGKSLAETLDEVHSTVEGVNNATAAYHLALRYEVEMPIVSEAYRVLFEGKDPRAAVTDLMCRGKKSETGAREEDLL